MAVEYVINYVHRTTSVAPVAPVAPVACSYSPGAAIALVAAAAEDPFLLASLPPCVTEVREDSRVEFVVLLSLTLFVDLCELIILLLRLPSVAVSLICSAFKALSCLFLLKFIIDVHPLSNFWVLLAFTSFPPLVLNVSRFLVSSRWNKSS